MKSSNLLYTTIMRTFTFLLLCIMCACKSYGQTSPKSYGKIDVEITKEKKLKRIYSKVIIMSPFFGGDSSWIRKLENTLNHSLLDLKKIKKGKYIVTAIFIASKDGTLSDIQCTTCSGFGMSEKVVRDLKKTMNWLPSSQGNTCKTIYNIIINSSNKQLTTRGLAAYKMGFASCRRLKTHQYLLFYHFQFHGNSF